MRKPSTPRSSQKRMTSCMASTTSGLSQFRSGCCGQELVEVPLLGGVVPGPGPAALDEGAQPVVRRRRRARRRPARRTSRASGRPGCCGPPGTTGAGRRCGSGRGRRRSGCPSVVGLGEQPVEGGQVAEEGVDVAEVGHVVAEVGHRRPVERRQPDGVDPQPGQVVEALPDALEVAHAVAVGVGEGPGVHLVDDAGAPPRGRSGGRHGRQPRGRAEVHDPSGPALWWPSTSPLRASGAVP